MLLSFPRAVFSPSQGFHQLSSSLWQHIQASFPILQPPFSSVTSFPSRPIHEAQHLLSWYWHSIASCLLSRDWWFLLIRWLLILLAEVLRADAWSSHPFSREQVADSLASSFFPWSLWSQHHLVSLAFSSGPQALLLHCELGLAGLVLAGLVPPSLAHLFLRSHQQHPWGEPRCMLVEVHPCVAPLPCELRL